MNTKIGMKIPGYVNMLMFNFFQCVHYPVTVHCEATSQGNVQFACVEAIISLTVCNTHSYYGYLIIYNFLSKKFL